MANKEVGYGVYDEDKVLVRSYPKSVVLSSKNKELDGVEKSPEELAKSFAENQKVRYGRKLTVKKLGSAKDEEEEEVADEEPSEYTELSLAELIEEAKVRKIALTAGEKKSKDKVIAKLEAFDASAE